MIFRYKISLIFPLMCCVVCSAGLAPEQATLTKQILECMEKSTAFFRSISTNGGYGGKYSIVLDTRYGEALHNIAKAKEIWIQPPGTPSVGMALLRAYQITRDESYLSAARETGRALAWSQRAEGGWGYNGDVSDLRVDSKMPRRKRDYCTLDDRTTQGALDFLMNLEKYINERWLSASVQAGLEYMLKAQFPNGAWPQQYPLRGGYLDYYTFNDGAINDCIGVMLTAHLLYNKEDYLDSARRGGDFIIKCQWRSPQAGWAQQYSYDLQPAKGRVFEQPGICSQVTGGNIETLVDLYIYTKDEKYLAPIPKAIVWLERSKIGPNTWSRLYEVGTNVPIYGDTDGKVHYTREELRDKNVRLYGWHGEYGIGNTINYYKQVKQLGAERYLAGKFVSPTTGEVLKKAQQVRKIISDLDGKEYWVRDNLIQSVDFVKNMNYLCGYLELNGPRAHDELLYWYCTWLSIKRPGKGFPYKRRGMFPFEELEMPWKGEYQLPIGEPTSEKYLQNNCVLRDYKNARIVVNPTKVSRSVVIDEKKSWLDWTSKKAVRQLEIPPFAGRILLPLRDNSYR